MQPSITPSPSARAACAIRTRLADPARLRELDVDPVRALGAGGDVGRACGSPRRRRSGSASAAFSSAPPGSPGGQRLLAVLDAERLQLRQRLERLLERPVLVHVHLERDVRHASHRTDALDVEPVAAAELELQALEPAPAPARPGGPCRPGRRARPSSSSAARFAGGRAGATRERPAASRRGRAARRRSPPWPPARRAARRAARSISSSANGSSPSRSPALSRNASAEPRALVVALDRSSLAVAAVAPVRRSRRARRRPRPRTRARS